MKNYTIKIGSDVKMPKNQSFMLYFSFTTNSNQGGMSPTFSLNGYCSAFLSVQHSEENAVSTNWGGRGILCIAENDTTNVAYWQQGDNLQTLQVRSLNSIVTLCVNGLRRTDGNDTTSFRDAIKETSWTPQPLGSTKMNGKSQLVLEAVSPNTLSVIHLSGNQQIDGYVASFSGDNGGVYKTVTALPGKILPEFTFPVTTGLNSNGTGCGIVAQGSFKRHLSLVTPQTLMDISDSNGTDNILKVMNDMLANMDVLVTAETCDDTNYPQADYHSPDDAVEMMLFQRS